MSGKGEYQTHEAQDTGNHQQPKNTKSFKTERLIEDKMENEKCADTQQNSWIDSERRFTQQLQSNDEMHNPNASSDKTSPVIFKRLKPNQTTSVVIDLTYPASRNTKQIPREAKNIKGKADQIGLKFKGIVLSGKLLHNNQVEQPKERSGSKQQSSSSKKKKSSKHTTRYLIPSSQTTLSPKNPHGRQQKKIIERCSTDTHLQGMIGHLIESNKRSHPMTAKEAQFQNKANKYSGNRSASQKQPEQIHASKPATQLYHNVAPRYLRGINQPLNSDKTEKPQIKRENDHLDQSPPASIK